jgi:hypothetical protein
MNAREFYDNVCKMRDAQKRFNDLSDDECMADVLKYESIIDAEILRVNNILKKQENEQVDRAKNSLVENA